MRNTFKAQYPNLTFGQLSKHTSVMYSQLTPEEKHLWQAKAEADKARYLNELTTYIPPPGYDSSGQFILTMQINKNKKKERDPTAPKRNLSAYLLYQNAMRDQFKRDNPGMTFGQLSKYTSHMYKALTFEEKSAWEYRSEQDKIRFEQEMKSYIPPHGYDCEGKLLMEYKMQRKINRKAAKDPNAPKRARGSYVLFTFDYRPKIMQEFPGIKFTDLGTVLGERWRSLSPEERKRYDDMAQEDKLRFTAEMDAYKTQKGHIEQQQQQLEQQQQQQLSAIANLNYQVYGTTNPPSYAQMEMGMAIQNNDETAQHRLDIPHNNIANYVDETGARLPPVYHQEVQQYEQNIQNQYVNSHTLVNHNDEIVLPKLEDGQQLYQMDDVNGNEQPEMTMAENNHLNYELKLRQEETNDHGSQ